MQKILPATLLLLALPAMAQQPKPFDCEGSAPHRAFDFWLGSWAVHDDAGTLQGLLDIVGSENAKSHRYAGIQRDPGDACRAFPGHVIEMRCTAP